MAGGVMTCQITGTPVCGKDTLAIIVRQGVYDWNNWIPMSIPSHGHGNDDFLALDSLEENKVNDMFAVTLSTDDSSVTLTVIVTPAVSLKMVSFAGSTMITLGAVVSLPTKNTT